MVLLLISDAQIRRASGLALRNISDPSAKLTKASIGKAGDVEMRAAEGSRSPSDDKAEAAAPRGSTKGADRNKRKHPDGERSQGEPTSEDRSSTSNVTAADTERRIFDSQAKRRKKEKRREKRGRRARFCAASCSRSAGT